MYCTNCDKTLEPHVNFCTACGLQTVAPPMQDLNTSSVGSLTCSGCGNGLEAGSTLCPFCGRQNVAPPPPVKEAKITFNLGGGEKSISLAGVSNAFNTAKSGPRSAAPFSPSTSVTPSNRPTQTELQTLPLTDGGSRFLAHLIDSLIMLFLALVTGGILGIAYLVWVGWIQGTGGQSLGYRATNQYLVSESDRQIIGGGAGIGRSFLLILDGLPLGIGYIVGLVTGQCFADRIMHTIVLKRPK